MPAPTVSIRSPRPRSDGQPARVSSTFRVTGEADGDGLILGVLCLNGNRARRLYGRVTRDSGRSPRRWTILFEDVPLPRKTHTLCVAVNGQGPSAESPIEVRAIRAAARGVDVPLVVLPLDGGTEFNTDFTVRGRHNSSGETPSAVLTVGGSQVGTPSPTGTSPNWSVRYQNVSAQGGATVVVTVAGQDSDPRNFTLAAPPAAAPESARRKKKSR